jgi:hypothetical protein
MNFIERRRMAMGIKSNVPYQSDNWNNIFKILVETGASATMRESVDSRTLSHYLQKLATELENKGCIIIDESI